MVLVLLFLSSGVYADDVLDGHEAYYRNKDFPKAALLYEKACNSGSALGCRRLAEMYEDGKGVKQDYVKAASLYEKGCNGNHAIGCWALGLMYEDGQGVKKDYVKALELFKKACDMKEERGCEEYTATLNKAFGQ